MITSVLDDKGLIHVFVTVPHGADLSKGCTVFELYQKPANAGWTGGATGKQKALAYPLARIPENVG